MTAASFLDNQPRSRLAVIGLAIATVFMACDFGCQALVLAGILLPSGSRLLLLVQAVWTLAEQGVLLFCAITFLLWFYRAYHNAAVLGLRRALAPGWAVGGWFVPIACLFIPFQIASAMWHQAGKDRVGSSEVLGAWWLTWLAGSILGATGALLSIRIFGGAPDATTSVLLTSGNASKFAAGLLAIRIVRRLSRAQEDMHLLARSNEAFGEVSPPMAESSPAPPPVAVSTVPGERPVVGSACGGCGGRIATAHDAFVCTDCDLPLHEDCLRQGACPRCRGRALDAGFHRY